MNKTELVAAIAEKAGISKKDADAAVAAFVATVTDAMKAGDKVALIGFGTFEAKKRAARTGINPKTKTMHIRHADMSESFTAQVFKTIADPFVGKLSMIKVISGVLTQATPLFNANADKPEKAAGIFMIRGKKQVPVNMLCAGDIGALSKLQYTSTGDSLCEIGKVVQYEKMEFPAPQISLAVYAKKAGEEDKVFSGLSRLCEELPDVIVAKDPMTTETLISGQGEL